MKFSKSAKSVSLTPVAVLYAGCLYYVKGTSLVYKSDLLKQVEHTSTLATTIEDIAKMNGAQCFYKGDTLEVTF